ncbi:MAG: cbb3-type cytochrome oxidase assembly protein CcoS [Helicobacteraceae bacterium]
MNAITLNLIVSLFLGAIGIAAFLWALSRGQFDDEDKSGAALLFDDEAELNRAIQKEQRLKKYEESKKAKEQN